MPLEAKKAERRKTDESLRTEREKTDRALVERQAAEENADGVVHHARENADAVLSDARHKADRGPNQSSHPPPAAIAEARVLEDDTVREQRASADETLRREREENERALAKLLPLEREQTDRYLLTERARSDVAISSRDDFLGIASHDLRSLIGGIVLNAGILARGAGDDEKGKRTLMVTDRIQRFAARMNRLVGDLVDVASIDAGKLAVLVARGDSADVIVQAIELFQAAAAAKGISLEMETVDRPLIADFDHDRMLQVLANLIANSLKFTSRGGKVRIRGERAGEELRFSVSDTGAGIAESMLEAIFERFWQASKGNRQGVGLGLYISKSIVLAHGGKIWAESSLGEGCTVRFTLPRAAEAAAPLGV